MDLDNMTELFDRVGGVYGRLEELVEASDGGEAPPLYHNPAGLGRVVDGDTIDYEMHYGFTLRQTWRVRLAGIDTAEIYGVPKDSPSYEAGQNHKQFVEDWHEVGIVENEDPNDPPFRVISQQKGKYGRYVAAVKRATDGATLNDDLVSEFGETVISN